MNITNKSEITQTVVSDKISKITKYAESLGFVAIGFCKPIISQQNANHIKNIVSKKKFGTMDWLAKSIEKRLKPNQLWPNVKTIICLATNYKSENYLQLKNKLENKSLALISSYAQTEDYHFVIKEKLKEMQVFLNSEFNIESKVYVDTAPVLEKHFAEQAKLGWQGKHTNLVSNKFGSWLFLSCIYIDCELDFNSIQDLDKKKQLPNCGSCTKCMDACPTDALSLPYQLKIESCIAYLTIEHKGIIDDKFKEKIGNRLFGCDDCLSVCPWNKFAQKSAKMKYQTNFDLTKLKLDDLCLFDQDKFSKVFKNTPVKRLKYNRFVRNLLIVIGNSKQSKYLPYIETKISEIAQNEANDDAIIDAASYAKKKLINL